MLVLLLLALALIPMAYKMGRIVERGHRRALAPRRRATKEEIFAVFNGRA